ncbi:DUF6440 family protein [Fictibacillus fluitans]|uniref:DUF6440 family protein n=1 Tax=Fictibacillus fluitans TaxID=3058422 RepID=A0ABT8HWI4_9BACL|nr:DUF6440 family protein [Fictibacillus sp. NE201]MDN4525148.1 DUF6440 family protein [Fictibacillus sp. NE201]
MENKRFEVIEKQGKMEVYQVVRDNETGVLYVSYASGFGVGFSVMVGQDGKPLVDNDYLDSKKSIQK